MKKIIIIAILALASTATFAQKSEVMKIFDQYSEVEGITSIKVAKQMFGLLNKLDFNDAELKKLQPLLSKVNSLNVLICGVEVISDSLLKADPKLALKQSNSFALQQKINAAVKGLKFEELVTVNSSGTKIKLLTANSNTDVLNGLLLALTSTQKNILMYLDGEVNMADVSKFVESQK